MIMKNRISVSEVAELMNVSEQFIRIGLQKGIFPFGYPEYEVVGGYLKILDESECGQLWWDSLSERYKNIIKAMPNFDKEIFEDVTGIKI